MSFRLGHRKTREKYSDVDIALIENPRKSETHTRNFEADTEEAKRLIGFEAKRRVEDEIRQQLGK